MSIERKPFGSTVDGKPAELITMKNASGCTLAVTTYGARIVSLLVPGRDGKFADVVLGHDSAEEYSAYRNFQGALVGRYGNRIANSQFPLDGEIIKLIPSEGVNQLHGGPNGYSMQIWTVDSVSDGDSPSMCLSLTAPDGEGGFPGTLQVKVTYTLTKDNALEIDYKAVSDKKTIVNLTNHSFFNLRGYDGGDICDTVLQINADRYTVTDISLIPTGEFAPVAGTPLDFTKGKPIGQDIDATACLMDSIHGFDHNFVISRKGDGVEKIAEAYEPESGRVMEVLTDLPGVQLFTANSFPEGLKGKNGTAMLPHHAFCLETQYFPDTPNHPNFPSCVVEAGQEYHTTTIYRFSVR